MQDVVARFEGLCITMGKKVFEVRPNVPWNKGKALLFLLEVRFVFLYSSTRTCRSQANPEPGGLDLFYLFFNKFQMYSIAADKGVEMEARAVSFSVALAPPPHLP